MLTSFERIIEDDGGSRSWDESEGPKMRQALLSLQRMPDVREYSFLGFLRDRGPALRQGGAGKSAIDSMSVYKVRMINVAATERVHYVAALTKFEDIAFNHLALGTDEAALEQLIEGGAATSMAVDLTGGSASGVAPASAAGGAGIPGFPAAAGRSFKSFEWVYRATIAGSGGATHAKTAMACDEAAKPSDVLEDGVALDELCEQDRAQVLEIVAWVQRSRDDDKRKDDAQSKEAALAPIMSSRHWQLDEEEEAEAVRQLQSLTCDADDALKATLHPHQRQGVIFMSKVERNAKLPGGILADEMGLGKTVTVIGLVCACTRLRTPDDAVMRARLLLTGCCCPSPFRCLSEAEGDPSTCERRKVRERSSSCGALRTPRCYLPCHVTVL